MNKYFKNFSLMLAAGAFLVSCADYNETDNFTAQPDPTVSEPYKDFVSVKSYTDRSKYPNMSLAASLKLSEFKNQGLEHAAAVANFDEYYFGTSFMSGSIANAKGVLNYYDLKEQLDHIQEVGGKVYGSAIAANANQADGWLSLLTAPIEILVEYHDLKTVDYSKGDPFTGTGGSIVTKDGEKVLKVSNPNKVNVIDGFTVDSKATYTTQVWLKADKGKTATFSIFFSGTQSIGTASQGRYTLEGGGEWTRFTVEEKPAEGEENGYLRIEPARGSTVYVRKVQVGYLPDNHRDQTEQEINDTIHYAMNTWCDGLMKNSAGRIQSFDLIEEPLSATLLDDGVHFDLKHSKEKIYWQDIFGSDKYAPVVSDAAVTAYKKYGGNADDLKFFIAEKGLDNDQKFESLMYWINDVWKQNGAKIDGINAKLDLVYDEDDNSANETSYDNLLQKLRDTGLLIRLSTFDITYQAGGQKVAAKDITAEQRQKLANYYADCIKKYLTTIDPKKQAGICKGNMVDTSDPVGLWATDSKTKDWVRTATYKAFCDALSGK